MRRPAAADVPFAAGLAIGLVLLWAGGFVDLLASRYLGSNDLSGIWAGPRALVLGMDPYDASTWIATADRLQRQHPETAVYGYPGYVALALLPLGALPVGVATVAWTVAGMALAALALRALLRAYAPGLPAVHTLAGLVLYASQPALLTFYDGQWSFFLVALLASFVVALRARRGRAAGLALAVAWLVKPQLLLVAASGLARVALARGAGRAILWGALAAAAALAVSVALLPRWPALYVEHVLAARVPPTPRATAVPTALLDLLGAPGLWVGAALVVVAVLAALAFDPRGDAALAVWIAVGAAAAPYTWSYDQLVLVVPLVVACGVLARGSPRAALALAVAGTALLTVGATLLHGLYGDLRGSESYNGLVSGCFALLVTALLWPHRRVRPRLAGP